MIQYLFHDQAVYTVEFHKNRPNVVLTARDGYTSYYDCNWCRRDKRLYYHCSGGAPFRGVADSPGNDVWVADGIQIRGETWTKRGGKFVKKLRPTHVLSKQELRQRGIKVRSKLPARLFDDASDEEVYYCRVCKDHLPGTDDGHCQHVTWCSRCGDFAYVQLPAKMTLLPQDEGNCPHLLWCRDCKYVDTFDNHDRHLHCDTEPFSWPTPKQHNARARKQKKAMKKDRRPTKEQASAKPVTCWLKPADLKVVARAAMREGKKLQAFARDTILSHAYASIEPPGR